MWSYVSDRVEGISSERVSTTLPPTTGTTTTTATTTLSTGARAHSNAASDVGPNNIEKNIIQRISSKKFRRFNYNWNNKVTVETQKVVAC